MATYGAEVSVVDGLIDEAGRLIRERAATHGWFDISTLREPYRVEGKKTMGFELAEAGGWGDGWYPDTIVFPTGGGTGIVGMWKAFDELGQLGWIGERRPRLVVVQAAGCVPLVRAFERGLERAEPWTDAKTIAAGIRVPSAIGDYLVLRAVRESGGTAVAVTDAEIIEAQRVLARRAGVFAAPEGAAAYGALPRLSGSGFLAHSSRWGRRLHRRRIFHPHPGVEDDHPLVACPRNGAALAGPGPPLRSQATARDPKGHQFSRVCEGLWSNRYPAAREIRPFAARIGCLR